MKKYHQPLRNLLRLGSALLFIGWPFQASALDPDRTIYQYNCHTWRRANGLPANAVTAIVQTEDGRLWLGTSQGLVYFDGVGFRVFDLAGEKGMESKVIDCLARRPGGGLWFGLDHGSFGYFDGQQFHSLQQAELQGPFATVRSMLETRDGRMLLGGSALAGNWVNTNVFKSLLPTTNADVFSIYEDARGRIWIGTADQGLFYWENGRLTAFPDQTLRNMVISAIAVDPAGDLWLGTAQNGLRRYNSNFQSVPLNVVYSQPMAMLVDRHGVLWIGTLDAGLIRYQGGKFTSLHKQDGLASDRILSLCESDDGSLWVGTVDGLSQLSDVKFPILSATEGLAQEACLAVAVSPNDTIWAGTPNGMSSYHDGNFTNFGVGNVDGFSSQWVKRIFAARNGDVYFIGGQKDLDRFRDDHVVMVWTNGIWPRAVAEDSHGILVAMAGNLMRIENDKLVPVRLANGGNVSLGWINELLVARDDSIWVADVTGVFQIKDGVLHNWCVENGLSQSTFYYMCEDDDGNIWAAQNTGIARFKDGGLQQITRKQGLHEDFVYAIVPDKLGNFWMDSNRGIFRVSQRELNAVADGTAERVQCTVYEGEDAVKTTDKSAQEYSGCRSSDGRIWFPSSKGIIMINPTNVFTNPRPPPVSIERVRINGQEYRPDQEPVLEPGPGNLEFDYSALDYQAPQKIQFRYRLGGYESDWVNAGNRREAFFTNLKPGRYHFQVQACNADGVWNTTGTGFALELPRRFHETIAFRVTCLVAVLGFGVYAWWVWHLRRQRAQLLQTRALLESKVQERTSELRNEIEERKRAEEALRESQALYLSLVEQMPAGVFRKDLEGRFVLVNNWFCRLKDMKPEEFLGKIPEQVAATEAARGDRTGLAVKYAAAGEGHHEQIMKTGKPIEAIEEYTKADGKKQFVHALKLPVFGPDGRLIGTQGILTDITDMKTAEAELRRSNEALARTHRLLQAMLDNVPDRIYFKDADSRFLIVSRSWAKRFGLDAPEDAIGKTDFDFQVPELAKESHADDQRIMETGEALINKVEKQVTPDGEVAWVSTNKVPMRDSRGRITGLVGINRDITEIKQAEEALRQSHEEFKNLFDDAPVGFHEVDTEGRLVRINNTELKLLGYSAEELLGQFVWEIAMEKDTSHEATLAKLRGEPPPEIFGRTLRRKDGSTFTALINDRILKDAHGAIVGIRSAVQDDTARQRAEAALRLSEERLLRVIAQTRCILNSGQVEGLAGWREKALSQQTPFRWNFPVQNEETAQRVLPLELAAGESYQEAWVRSWNHADLTMMDWNSGNAFLNDLPFYRNEFRCTDKNGMGHWMQQSVTIRKLAENRWEVFGITTDISDLKRIEAELRESQALYHSLVNQMSAGIYRKDAKGRYVFVNPTYCRLMDMSPEQFLGKTILETGSNHATLAAKGDSRHRTIMHSGNQIEDDEVYTRADGQTRYYHFVRSPVFDSAGKIVGTQGVVSDVTERRWVEEALRWSETQLQVILDSTADGILAVDSQGKAVIKANRRFAELWRIPQSLIDAGDNRAMLDFARKQLSNPDAYLNKTQLLYGTDKLDMDTLAFKDGRIFERYGFPMMMDGVVTGRVWSFRDITGRQRQEKELSEKNTELERFTYTVSHDLKSPLVTVKTFLGYLEQDLAGSDQERIRQDVAYIHTAADKMGQLLDELLNLVRVGRKMNPAERVTFKELVQEVVRLVAGRISTGGAEVQVADAAVVLEGDRPRLMEVWQNLVENACKFMGNQPKPRVEIGVEQRESETVFFVRDNGMGIEPRYQTKVFGLFEKLDPKGEGTGMGLALVKRIVEIYKGRIWVESPGLGQGATFLFTLPGAVVVDPEQSS